MFKCFPRKSSAGFGAKPNEAWNDSASPFRDLKFSVEFEAESSPSGKEVMPFALRMQNHMPPSSAGTPPKWRENSLAVTRPLFFDEDDEAAAVAFRSLIKFYTEVRAIKSHESQRFALK